MKNVLACYPEAYRDRKMCLSNFQTFYKTKSVSPTSDCESAIASTNDGEGGSSDAEKDYNIFRYKRF